MIKKNLRLILSFILILNFLSLGFSEVNVNKYEYIKLNITNQIEFSISKDSRYSVNSFILNSYFFPQTFKEAQYLNSFESSFNKFNVLNNSGIFYLRFEFDENSLKTYNKIENNFILESIPIKPNINATTPYPILNLKKEDREYVEFVDLIDIDTNIRNKASEIAEGESDVFIIAAKIAKWIEENIEYDLSTINEIPNQKSSEVFLSRRGVCKEASNLFISMMRSLGIPARIVTGYAYTNSQDIVDLVGSNWGGHAWTEVLIGDYWVPFDLTYNQYGYVDASHIIFDKSKSIRSTSALLNASGYGFSLVDNSLKVDNNFEIIDFKDVDDLVEFNLTLTGPTKLGFSSYGFLKLDIKNSKNAYQILFVKLAKVKEVELLDSDEKMLIFKPLEEKQIYFRYKIPNNLDSNYKYTYPFTIYFNDVEVKTLNLEVQKNYRIIEDGGLLPKENSSEKKDFSENPLNLECNFFVDFPENTLLCSIQNTNNFEINNLNICLDTDCQKIDLKLNEVKSFSFNTDKEKVSLFYNFLDKLNRVDFVLQKPSFTYTTEKKENQVFLKYKIENYRDDLILRVFLNGDIFREEKVNQNSFYIPLENEITNVSLKLMIGPDVIEEMSFVEKIPRELTIDFQQNASFWERLVVWIKKIFG